MTLAAITVKAPWSWAIAEAAALTALDVAPKLVENRGRPVPQKWVGQDIAIHAGQTWSAEGGRDPRIQRAWRVFSDAIHLTDPNPLLAAIGDRRTGFTGGPHRLRIPSLWIDSGAVVAVARLVDCHQAEDTGGVTTCCAPWGDRGYGQSGRDSWMPARVAWHLVLADVRRLVKPVEVRGHIAVPWTLPADVEAQVRAQLAEQVTA